MAVDFCDVSAFVLDMDGTVYLGENLLPGASEFIACLRQEKIPFLFFTNNSAKAENDYIRKLSMLGIAITPDEIMTSGRVMIDYLKANRPGESVYLLGTPALENSFLEADIVLSGEANIAVAGFDQTLTYEKLCRFCDHVRNGASFYATHPDRNCPVAGGFIPDLGAMLALIEASTGRKPDLIVGKPYLPTVEAVAKRLRVPVSKLVFIGDRLYTDIAAAVDHGAKGILVLSGETKASDLSTSAVKPDAVYAGLTDLLAAMKGDLP